MSSWPHVINVRYGGGGGGMKFCNKFQMGVNICVNWNLGVWDDEIVFLSGG